MRPARPVWAGTDRWIQRHPAPAPQHTTASAPRHVAVIGGGIAGLSAATALAEHGVTVDLIERETYLGGRVGAWPDQLRDGTSITMGRGFHAFFKQYYNLRRLLSRTDPSLRNLASVGDYPLLDPEGRLDTFRGLPRQPPLNALGFAWRSPTFAFTDMLRLNPRAALPLVTVQVPHIYQRLDETAADKLLDAVNFPTAARHLAFEVFSRSFFADPSQLSAAELAVMFHIYFLGSSEGLLFDVPTDTFAASLWGPLHEYLTTLGVTIHTGTTVTAIESGGHRKYRVHAGTSAVDADAVVLACDIAGLRKILASSPELGSATWRRQIATLRTAPPFLVHRLWLDRPVGTHRPAFLGTGGWGALDNISVLDRYEREAQLWSARHGGSVVELHAYAAPDHPETTRLVRHLEQQLFAIYPEIAEARVLDTKTLWRADCPLFEPGSFARRPTVCTPDEDLMLAGDGIRIDLPVALMERAATTGLYAANLLLAKFGLPGYDLYTVPNHARFRPLRELTVRANR